MNLLDNKWWFEIKLFELVTILLEKIKKQKKITITLKLKEEIKFT